MPTAMTSFLSSLRCSRGLGLALLLVLLGASTALSLQRSQQLEQQVAQLEGGALPMVRDVHAMARQVDELRGMAALHLMLRSPAERAALETRMQGLRRQLDGRLVAATARQGDAAGLRHGAAVRASLDRFWTEQDRLLASSRQAASDPAAAEAARALLSGASQQAFEQIGADLDAWWRATEQAAGQVAELARSEARSTAFWLAGLALAGLALALRIRPPVGPQPALAHAAGAAGVDPAGRADVWQLRRRAIDAAVQSARAGASVAPWSPLPVVPLGARLAAAPQPRPMRRPAAVADSSAGSEPGTR